MSRAAHDEIVLSDRSLGDVRERRAPALKQDERERRGEAKTGADRLEDGETQGHNLTGTIVIPTNEL